MALLPNSAAVTTVALFILSTSYPGTIAFAPASPSRTFERRASSVLSPFMSVGDDGEDAPPPAGSASSGPPGVAAETLAEATDALNAVGWGGGDIVTAAELTSDDPFVRGIDESIRAEMGVGLDGLLNPAKVVNLERDLYNLRSELAVRTGMGATDVVGLSTAECDGGGGGEEAEKLRMNISKKEASLGIERRSVFRGWLKNIFLGQAALSLAVSAVMVTNPGALFGGFDWFETYSFDQPIRVLGFWWWWLFIVPSLRSRRPSGAEKRALDIAFLGTPLISLALPAVTKDCAIIWVANLAVVAGSYAFAFTTEDEDGGNGDDNQPKWLKFIYSSLDFGSGKERGTRK